MSLLIAITVRCNDYHYNVQLQIPVVKYFSNFIKIIYHNDLTLQNHKILYHGDLELYDNQNNGDMYVCIFV